jgi:hypothetical protein
VNPQTPPSIAHDPTPRLRNGLLLAWGAFWLLMLLVGVQEEWRDGSRAWWWRPVLGEGSSAIVATAIAVAQWRLVQRLDPLLANPARWFARVLVWLPLLAAGFVLAIFGLRWGVRELAGLPHGGDSLGRAFFYEALKFSIFYLLFSGLQFGLRSYLAWHAERLRAERLARLSQQAQLAQLAQQLQPHFLFNALNTVSSLIHTDPQLADTLLMRLAALLRAATDVSRRPQQPLADELALLEGYAAIMCERFADRVLLSWHIDPRARACLVPTLGLQPLLENCFCHVVERRIAATHIRVSAQLDEQSQRLRITVEDDGGVLAGTAPAPGVGLGNLRQRLDALHGAQASLNVRQRDGGAGVTAEVVLPCAC